MICWLSKYSMGGIQSNVLIARFITTVDQPYKCTSSWDEMFFYFAGFYWYHGTHGGISSQWIHRRESERERKISTQFSMGIELSKIVFSSSSPSLFHLLLSNLRVNAILSSTYSKWVSCSKAHLSISPLSHTFGRWRRRVDDGYQRISINKRRHRLVEVRGIHQREGLTQRKRGIGKLSLVMNAACRRRGNGTCSSRRRHEINTTVDWLAE